MLSRLITCDDIDNLTHELDVYPEYRDLPETGTGWREARWYDRTSLLEPVFVSYTYYDRDYPEECVHLDLR